MADKIDKNSAAKDTPSYFESIGDMLKKTTLHSLAGDSSEKKSNDPKAAKDAPSYFESVSDMLKKTTLHSLAGDASEKKSNDLKPVNKTAEQLSADKALQEFVQKLSANDANKGKPESQWTLTKDEEKARTTLRANAGADIVRNVTSKKDEQGFFAEVGDSLSHAADVIGREFNNSIIGHALAENRERRKHFSGEEKFRQDVGMQVHALGAIHALEKLGAKLFYDEETKAPETKDQQAEHIKKAGQMMKESNPNGATHADSISSTSVQQKPKTTGHGIGSN